MLVNMNPLKNFFDDLKHIKEPLPRFRVAQLLFIWCLTFAWFKEGFMRITAGLALLLMWKTMPIPHFSLERKDFSRTTWFIVLAFFVWIFTIPLMFGATTLTQELRSFLKPLETLIFILFSLFFFRGEDFEERFTFWAVVGLCAFIFSCAVNRYINNFADARGLDTFLNFTPMAAIQYISMWLGCLVCYLFKKKSNLLIRILALIAILIAPGLALISYYRGAILACVATLLFALFFAFLLIRQSVLVKLSLVLLIILLFLGVATTLLLSFADKCSVPFDVWQGRLGLTSARISQTNLFEGLSTGRWSAWRQEVDKIRVRPLAGYGLGLSFKSFNIRSDLSRALHYDEVITHPHNTMLQVAIHTGVPGLVLFLLSQLVLFILAISKTVASKHQTLYFTFAIMVVAKFFSGLTEGFFMPARYFLVPFWCLAFYVMFNESQTNAPESV